jgi:hypothetical protein
MKLYKQIVVGLMLTVLASHFLSSCANIIPPGGGPRDSLPPHLLTASPKDSALNVNTHNFTLTFDEFINLDNWQQNLIISPMLKYNPQVDSKLRNLTIRLKDTLEPNTTYTFDFGNTVRDVNEGNIARNLSYTFSTGTRLDHYSYSGKVLVAEKGKPDSTLFVVLHTNLADSAAWTQKPRYYTRINGKGEFLFRNLPEGDFAVYVIPNNFTKRYDDTTGLFAFRNTPVHISNLSPRDTLYAFQAVQKKPIPGSSSLPQQKAAGIREDKRLRYGLSLENGQQDLLDKLTLSFQRKLGGFDSTKIMLCDTNYKPLSVNGFLLDSTKTKLSLSYNWKPEQGFRLLIAKDAVTDTGGVQLSKADTIRFTTKKETDYGSLRLRFSNLDLSKKPVLQFIQNDAVVESVVLTQAELFRKLYRPGTYELRILFDTNGNGVWDTGHFRGGRRQPEIVVLIPRQVVIRANWDNEVNLSL